MNFEIATRKKFRFPYKGSLSTEDLWDLTPAELDKVFKVLNGQAKQASEESLLAKRSTVDEDTLVMIDIVKHIVSVKLSEAEARTAAVAAKQQRATIMEIIANKRNENLSQMTIEELEKLL